MNPILLDLPDSVETERLLLRCARNGEGPAMNAAIIESIAELRQWMPWARESPSVEQSEAYGRQAQADFQTRSDLTLRMLRHSDGLVVGSIGLHPRNWEVPSFEPRRGSRHLELSQNLLCFPYESAYSFFSGLSPGG